jgi:hypothetical protein
MTYNLEAFAELKRVADEMPRDRFDMQHYESEDECAYLFMPSRYDSFTPTAKELKAHADTVLSGMWN